VQDKGETGNGLHSVNTYYVLLPGNKVADLLKDDRCVCVCMRCAPLIKKAAFCNLCRMSHDNVKKMECEFKST
jgi:hypothetical protein